MGMAAPLEGRKAIPREETDRSSANFPDHLASMFFSLAGGFWMAHYDVHHIPDIDIKEC